MRLLCELKSDCGGIFLGLISAAGGTSFLALEENKPPIVGECDLNFYLFDGFKGIDQLHTVDDSTVWS